MRRKSLSRLEKVRKKRELKQALVYFLLAVAIVIGVFVWGVPAFAKLAGLFIADKDGESGLSNDQEVWLTAPILNDLPEATNSAELKVSGYAEPGTEVEVFLNNLKAKSVVADKEGNFVTKLELKEGENWLYAQAKKGNKVGPKSRDFRVVFDKTPIEIKLVKPTPDEKEFRGEEERVVEIVGETNKPVEEVKVGGRIAIVEDGTRFRTNYSLSEGDNLIEIVVRDKAGNEAKLELKLKWQP